MAEVDNKVPAEVRTQFGKGFARRLRVAGQIPAVVYGHGAEVIHVAVPARQVTLLLRKKNAILDLQIDGKSTLALVKDVQKDPVRQIIEHIDLVTLVKGERVHVEVPVHIVGESLSGTVIDLEHKTVKLEVAATSIPDFVEAIFDKQGAGFHVLAKDLIVPAGAKLELAADELIASVVATAAGHAADLAAAE